MDKRHVSLADLPQFTITAVDADGTEAVLAGVFDQLQSVRVGRAWLYRPNDGSLEGELLTVDGDTRAARILVAREGLPVDIQPGVSVPYFYGYFEPNVVDMIPDPSRVWVRVKYEPTDSVRIIGTFLDGPLYGEIEVGTPIPSGFHSAKVIPKGWGKENCILCHARIGPADQPFGYRDSRDVAAGLNSCGYWLCEYDYETFASRHDLGFLST